MESEGSEETMISTPKNDVDYDTGPHLKNWALAFYYVSFIVITVLTIYGLYDGDLGETLVGLPMIIILGVTVLTDRKSIHVPPVMVVMVVLAFILAFIGRCISTSEGIVATAANILTGMNLGILGLIVVYILLRSMPGVRDENNRVVAFVSVCIAIAAYSMTRLLQYILVSTGVSGSSFNVETMMFEMGGILIGSLIVALYHSIKGGNSILNSFLEENSEVMGLEDMEKVEIQRVIDEGESERVEYKSTLRTNLQTGEIDKRMEKAVLKTIVAFLNSNGGTLLIGVADDGSIIGSDVGSFDNRDKMGLHLGNLISAQIGTSFIPYINFVMVDYDDKTVIRVKCAPCPKPVFLKDGKNEIFYVRKGPQTEELTGMNLINYVNNRSDDKKKKLFS